jgi:hypothetical protein
VAVAVALVAVGACFFFSSDDRLGLVIRLVLIRWHLPKPPMIRGCGRCFGLLIIIIAIANPV